MPGRGELWSPTPTSSLSSDLGGYQQCLSFMGHLEAAGQHLIAAMYELEQDAPSRQFLFTPLLASSVYNCTWHPFLERCPDQAWASHLSLSPMMTPE